MSVLPLTKKYYATCVIILLFATTAFSQIQIWGTSQTGGEDAIGSIYSVFDDGSQFQSQSEFINAQDGSNPKSSLAVDETGTIFGISSQGGASNSGTLFRYTNGEFEVLYELNSATDGNNASADLIQIDSETFVGATFNGGENGGGVLFKYSLSSGFDPLFHFDANGVGSNPTGSIVYIDGDIYGTCSNGGNFGFGSVWKYSNSSLNVLYSFQGNDPGSYPRSGVILGSDNSLYGSTQFGGEFNQGTIFKIETDGTGFETIYSLNSATSDGRYPIGKLVESSPGVFLGLCAEGGTSGSGSVFKVTDSGDYSVLRALQSPLDGGFPKAGLSNEIDGRFYGVTEFGGPNGFGTVFSVEENGNYTVHHNFDYTDDGGNAQAALTVFNSMLYGCAAAGGANNFGTVFSFNPEGTLDKLHDFSLPLGGSSPKGLFNINNNFYGIAATGGSFNTGVFYKVSLSGEKSKLHDFDPEMEGQNPNGDLYWSDENGVFYGSARFGGLTESGSVYSINEEGDLTTLYFFEGGAQGEFPYSSPVLHSNGNLYGTTLAGGTFGDGVLYSIDQEGNYTVLHNFFGFFEGSASESQMVETESGLLYGLCSEGGSFNSGSLFEFNPETNAITILHNFSSTSDGSSPKSKLLLHSDGNLYGTTSEGLSGGGSVFRYSFTNGFEVLHAMNPTSDGSSPDFGLVEGNDAIYGVCREGGVNSFGTCFKYSDMNGFEVVYSFSVSESPNPTGAVALFSPECDDDDACSSEDPCSVAICDFGICNEIALNPEFTVLNTGLCQAGSNQFALELQLDLDISPAGLLNIGGEEVQLFEDVNSYTFELSLEADGEEIILDYLFSETGCEGSTASLGISPDPCPPTTMSFILDVNDLEVSPEGIHLGGTFQNWEPAELPMNDMGDGIWELTTEIGQGTYEYNFFNGSGLFDSEYVIGECSEDGKRQLTVGEEPITVEACWESCEANCSLSIVENSLRKNIKLYPNVGERGFEINLIIGESLTSGTYEIIDAIGRKVVHGPVYRGRNTLSTSSLNSGLFHIIIYDSGGAVAARRLIVQ